MSNGSRFTVFLKSTASFFGGRSDASFLVHVVSSNPTKAIGDAQEKIINDKQIDRQRLDAAGGADAIIPVMYVLPGHHESCLKSVSYDGPGKFVIRRNGAALDTDAATWEAAKQKCRELMQADLHADAGIEPSENIRPLPFGEHSMAAWEVGPSYYSISEVRAQIAQKW